MLTSLYFTSDKLGPKFSLLESWTGLEIIIHEIEHLFNSLQNMLLKHEAYIFLTVTKLRDYANEMM